MRSDSVVHATLSEVGIPGTKSAWPLGNAPPLPWFAFRRRRGGEVHADNDNYQMFPHYRAELYYKENDPDLLEAFERAVGRLGTWTIYEDTYLESESCYMTAYEFTLTKKPE